ncbi:MAG: hypothetical protein ABH877_00415 [bacterium]
MSPAPGHMVLGDLVSEWRATAKLFRGHEQATTAVAYEKCADALEEALALESEAALTLHEAAAESGYTADHLGRMVREGKIPNAGMPGSPLIAKRDLPRKPDVAPRSVRTQIDRAQIVRSAISAGV